MTDTSIRVCSETRRRLNVYASMHDVTQDEALQMLLDKEEVPTPSNE